MGRGLSDLQKSILVMAYGNHEPTRGSFGCDLYTKDVLTGYYGWVPVKGYLDSPGSQSFDIQAIGEQKYRSTRAAVSRAFRRLERRGLVTRVMAVRSVWAGINLTEEGAEVAQSLSVNSAQIIP